MPPIKQLNKPKTIIRICATHGEVEFSLENRDAYRCLRCRRAKVIKFRRKNRAKLLEAFGNRCEICGYDKYGWALEFHHVYPKDKKFGISGKGQTLAFARLLAEAKKCVLICANCHREIEGGVTVIPQRILDRIPTPS